MTQNKLSIHVESGEIFYDNDNPGENFYNFLLSQQNGEAAYMFQKNFLTETVLKLTLVLSHRIFPLMINKSLIFYLLKIQSIFFIVLMTLLKHMEIQDINCFTLKKC